MLQQSASFSFCKKQKGSGRLDFFWIDSSKGSPRPPPKSGITGYNLFHVLFTWNKSLNLWYQVEPGQPGR